MINPETEKIYNIILSIFLGVVIAFAINSLFDSPRIINVYA